MLGNTKPKLLQGYILSNIIDYLIKNRNAPCDYDSLCKLIEDYRIREKLNFIDTEEIIRILKILGIIKFYLVKEKSKDKFSLCWRLNTNIPFSIKVEEMIWRIWYTIKKMFKHR